MWDTFSYLDLEVFFYLITSVWMILKDFKLSFVGTQLLTKTKPIDHQPIIRDSKNVA